MIGWRIKDIVRLDIDEHNYFTIDIPVPYALINLGVDGDVYFHSQPNRTNHQSYNLLHGTDELWGMVGSLGQHIQRLLMGKCELAPERLHRLGYEFNQHERDIWCGTVPPTTKWDGWTYSPFFSYIEDPTTWLYTCEGSIYLEITPTCVHKKYKIPFKVFMRNYRPYFVKILTMEQLLHLHDQAKAVADLMLANHDNPNFVAGDYEHRRPKERPPAHCIRPLVYAAQHPMPQQNAVE